YASIDCLMWADVMDRTEVNGRLPTVGDVVGVEGKVKQTVRGRRVHDEDTDDTDDSASETEPALELLINQVWFADIDDSPSVTDGPGIAGPALAAAVRPAATRSVPAPAAVPAERAPMNAPAAA